MKVFASISLFVILFAPGLISYSWLSYQKRAVKHEVKWKMIAGIDKNELVLLKFTSKEAKDLKWEHAKEFEYQKEMYDVVEKQTIGDTTYYWCWWDHEETALNKQLSLLMAKALNANTERKEQQDWLSSYFKSLYLLHTSTWNFNNSALSGEISSVYLLNNYFTYIPLSTPPPEHS